MAGVFGSNVRNVSLSSALFAALVGLVLLYLVPNRARTKQILLEARQEDRFSPELRVIARSSKTTTPKVGEITAASARCGYVLTQTNPPETIMMRRPNVVADRMAAQSAAERERRRVQLARRGAAARRRLVLTMVLLIATVAGGVWAAATSISVLFAVGPAVILGAVLVLGRRAVVLNERADARYARLQEARAQDLAAASDGRRDDTVPAAEVTVTESEAADEDVTEEVADAGEDETWTPVPVPAPTYTMKAPAPRMEPPPLELPEYDYLAPSALADQGAEAGETATAPGAEPGATAAESELDLDAILDRRRAAGA